MSIEKLPDLNLPDFGNLRDAARPVLSFEWSAKGAHRAAAHQHARAHIICPEQGDYWVTTPEGTWLVPAGQAIWIPPDIHHQVYSHGSVTASVLFVDPAHAARLPNTPGTVCVTSLLRELLRRTVAYGNDYAPAGAEARLARVMLDELAKMDFQPVSLPIARDPRLARAMRHMIEAPERDTEFAALAREAAASPRTLARLFRSETGMTFKQWRTNLRLSEALKRLAEGATVTGVAADLGYSSTSAFIYMFRKNLGTSPGRYLARH